MARRIPPLTALRAFEAAGRHLSFTKAADELHVTQAAVSHQVKSLEEYLGLKLFRRLNRTLLLTDAGQLYLPPLTDAFEGIDRATHRLRRQLGRTRLTVSVLPSFAAGWLVPRLGRFRKRCPDVDLRIDPTAAITDFGRGDVDLGIRYGRGSYPGLRADRLMREEFFPVCSPRLLEGPAPLRDPADLVHHTLLHDEATVDWRTWLLAAGVERVDAERGITVTDSSMLLRAAIAGQGVALARSVLAADEIASGRLVRPFDVDVPTEFAYYLAYPEESAGRPDVAAFREWILEEARAGGNGGGVDDDASMLPFAIS